MKSLALFCLFLAIFGQIAYAVPRINVISPSTLSSKFESETFSGIPFKVGNYGKVPYGAHIIGAITVAKPSNGCDTIKEFRAGEYSFDQNVIAIVESGGCPYTVKSRNAQAAGAKIVVIIHDKNELPLSFGVGSDTQGITIPSILIPKDDGQKLLKFVEHLRFPPLNPEDIVPIVSINFPYDVLSDGVNLDFWFSAADNEVSYDFLNTISYYALNAPNAFKFTPHFVTWDCLICKRLDYETNLSGDCISGGRYCAPDPDDEGPLTGADIVYEGLRQACIWKNSQKTWWEYTSYYATRCLTDRSSPNIDQSPEDCSYEILNLVANPNQVEQIKKCVEDSFIPKDGKVDKGLCDNTILSAERELQLQYDISDFPILLINHRPYDDELSDFNSVMSEVCKKMKNAPEVCSPFKQGQTKDLTRHHFGVSLTLVVVLLMSALVLFYCYRRITKRKLGLELSMEANNMVSRYMSLKDLGVEPTKEADEETVN